ncbi:MAG: hypothetical protein ACLTZB_08710 [Streptococcus salivarius]
MRKYSFGVALVLLGTALLLFIVHRQMK